MGEYLLGSESFVRVAETGAPLNSIHRDPNGEKPIRLTRRGYGNVSKEVEQ